jgi:orotidine-5'-phosphate decarboxylase
LSLGCDGVVSSGLEAAALRSDIGDRLLIVIPGIRPLDNRPRDDQKRVVSVEDAFRSGADYIVVGRPIRNAPHPREAALGIQETIARIFAGRGPLASNQGQKL